MIRDHMHLHLPRAVASRRLTALLLLAGLAACGHEAQLTVSEGTGPSPKLPPPSTSLFPTMNTAKADKWPAGAMPTPAAGLAVNAYASGLDHPRWLYTLPNGDVLVAETDAPPKPDSGGIKAFFMKLVMKFAGSSHPSADRITLLRDADGDGTAETRSVLLSGLFSPFGMALVGDRLYVANADAVVSFPYTPGATRIEAAARQLIALPGGPINHHWTKGLVASLDGSKLYVSVGSNSNVAENGMAAEAERAAIWEIDIQSGSHRDYATGLRNPIGMAFEPESKALWVVVNERDELGSDLVPDYLTSVKEGAFYGWPYSYFGSHVDSRVEPQQPALVAKAIAPDYALGPHVAALGLSFAGSAASSGANRGSGSVDQALGKRWASGAFIGEHGSWNRKPRSGYKVVFVPFSGGQPAGLPTDVLSGFVNGDKANGRPVGVMLDSRGALLVADDVGGTVWRLTSSTP